ncbi:hypothetical protein F5X96DRAFT_672179 [Biscogniauxia mediterranea]|nr:hypothetical protein F5X96DRAFT_672179 [Biscogniauxia mediterranea]
MNIGPPNVLVLAPLLAPLLSGGGIPARSGPPDEICLQAEVAGGRGVAHARVVEELADLLMRARRRHDDVDRRADDRLHQGAAVLVGGRSLLLLAALHREDEE